MTKNCCPFKLSKDEEKSFLLFEINKNMYLMYDFAGFKLPCFAE